jgi:hypothetical protein
LFSLVRSQFIPAVNGKLVGSIGAAVPPHELSELRIAEGSDFIY